MRFELATTRDPHLLVPGSLEALHADADDLDARAATLSGAAADVGRHVVASWIGDAASNWAPRREALTDGLVGVADVLTFAASVLRAHADVLAWGRERAAVAADMWENVPGLSATGGLVHFGRDRSGQPGMLSPHQVFGSHLGDPFGLRAMAEAVLADARRQVAASEEAAAQVLDSLSEGMPDGRWDPSQFVFALGQWLLAKAAGLPVVLATRAIVDHDGLVAEGEAANEALGALGEMAVHNPEQVVPTLLDTQTLEDNPAAWWGAAVPEVALSAVGAGVAGRIPRWLESPPRVPSPAVVSPLAAPVAGRSTATSATLTAAVNPMKFDYLFGRVTSNGHNLGRSVDLQRHFARVGVYDTPAGRALILEHLEDVVARDDNIIRTFQSKYGMQEIRDSLFVGPGGIRHLETTWMVEGTVRRLSTVYAYGAF